jgi:hypothetical protein
MAGQGDRVWPSRLIQRSIAGLLVLIAVLGGMFLVGRAWFLSSLTEAELQKPTPGPVVEPSDTETTRPPHPLDPVLAMARKSLELHRTRDRDYQATLVKRLRMGNKLSEPEVMKLKLRCRDGGAIAKHAGSTSESQLESQSLVPDEMEPRPIDVYLGFEAPKSLAGREVIWRQGVQNDLMTVHEAGFLNLARLQLAPNSRLAMIGNRYPISDVGIERLLIKLVEMGTRDRMLGDCQVAIREGVEFEGRRCRRIEVIHPEKGVEIDGNKFEFAYYRAEIDMDVEYELPIHYASYIWPEKAGEDPLLDEEFTYRDLRLNCSLSDLDFDPDNPEYRYPSR